MANTFSVKVRNVSAAPRNKERQYGGATVTSSAPTGGSISVHNHPNMTALNLIEYDEERNALKINADVYATGGMAAYGYAESEAGGGGKSYLSELLDVVTQSLAGGQVLTYDAQTKTWRNTTPVSPAHVHTEYADKNHSHDYSATYAAKSHTHDDRYYTESEINTKVTALNTAIAGKSDTGHTHDDRYYTESEINTKVTALNTAIAGKSATGHTHSTFGILTAVTSGIYASGYFMLKHNNTDLGIYFAPQSTGALGIYAHEKWGWRKDIAMFDYDGKFSVMNNITARSVKTLTLCIESNADGGVDNARSGEINRFNGPLYLQHKTSYNLAACCGGGNVGIGTTAPSEKLHVSGNILATGNVTAYSDRRLKSEIEDMAERAPLRPRTYVKDGRRQIGFIAQEVREAYPEAVTETQGEDHLLALDYGSLTAALAAQNNALRQRVERLEAMVERLMRERG